jgi:hypothetical protein
MSSSHTSERIPSILWLECESTKKITILDMNTHSSLETTSTSMSAMLNI